MYGEGDRKLSERIKLTEDTIKQQMYEISLQGQNMTDFARHFFASSLFRQILDDQENLEKIKDMIKSHDGSDYNARQIFDDIEHELLEKEKS